MNETLDAQFLWDIFRRNRLRILLGAILGGALFFGVANLIAPRYECESRWLPESQASASNGLMALVGLSNLMTSSSNNESSYEVLLQSDEFLSPLVDKEFSTISQERPKATLLEIFRIDTTQIKLAGPYLKRQDIARQIVLEGLRKAIELKTMPNYFSLTTKSSDPLVCRDLNLAILDLLNEFNRQSQVTTAGRESEFLEERLTFFEEQLAKAEQALLAFRLQNKSIQDDRLELAESRLVREVSIQNTLVLEFRKQMELSRVKEKKEATPLRIIQPPRTPYLKAWPKRKVFLAVGFSFGAILVYGWFLVAAIRRTDDA